MRVAIVTGAGRGIGRAEALALAASGLAVVVNDPGYDVESDTVNHGPARDVVAAIQHHGGRAVADFHDCATSAGADAIVQRALDEFGRLDVLVNNAGIFRGRMVFNMTEDDFDEVVRVHLKGHFLMTRAASRHWRAEYKAGRPVVASVVNTISDSAFTGRTAQVNYAAAKGGIVSMTIALANELAPYGITVNAVAPGQTRTRMLNHATGGAAEAAVVEGWDRTDPANVAPVIVWLADPAIRFSGEMLFIEGGTLIRYSPWQPTVTIELGGP